jgi:UDP-2-acetamido-3-amino-2,3-dideoxy-glucuronate N-acetyltransferase
MSNSILLEKSRPAAAAHTEPKGANVAVIGCGYWGKNLVRNFAQLGALTSVCDTDESLLSKTMDAYPTVLGESDPAAVINDPDIQAVVIATPAVTHYDLVKSSLEAGKDVFVEKPLATRLDHGAELIETAAMLDRILMVGHILEYHPAVRLLKSLIDRGELGEIRYVYSNRLNLGKVRKEENILWSFAPHDISVICRLVGTEPIEVSATGGAYLQTGIADVTVSNLLFDGGARAHLFVSWLHPHKEQRLVVVGDQKMAVFDDTLPDGKLKIFDTGIEWKAGMPVPRQTAETTLYHEKTEPLRLECEHFLQCVREHRAPLTDGESALRVLRVLEASQRSVESHGAPVTLKDL